MAFEFCGVHHNNSGRKRHLQQRDLRHETDVKQAEEAKNAPFVDQEPAESDEHDNANIGDVGNVADADTDAVGESTGPVADERIDHDAEAPSPTEDRVAGDDGSGEDPRDWEVETEWTDLDGEEIAPASDWETRDPGALDELSPSGADPHDFSVRDTPEFVDPRTTGIDSKPPEQSEGPGHAWEEYGVDKNPILTYTSETDEIDNIRQTNSDGTVTWFVEGESGGIRTDPETGEVIEIEGIEVDAWIGDHSRVREDDPEILKEIAADEAAPKTPLREAVDAREAQKEAEATEAAQELQRARPASVTPVRMEAAGIRGIGHRSAGISHAEPNRPRCRAARIGRTPSG